jgi:hypothetical protein
LEIEIAKRDKEARDWIGALIVLFFVIGGGAGFVFVVEPIVKIEPASRQLGRSNLSKEKKTMEQTAGFHPLLLQSAAAIRILQIYTKLTRTEVQSSK